MKKLILLTFVSLLFVGSIFAQKGDNKLETVSNVDLNKYAGKWYEIARYPNKFQKKCVGNTTATYKLNDNGTVQVINECLKKNGKVNRAKGKARIEDKETNAKLEVRFAPAWLSWLPQVWGDYWIIDLDEDYSYAAIGDPDREYFWILSREPEMDDTVYQNILRRAEEKGFNPEKVIETPQDVVVENGRVLKKSKT